MTCTAPENLLLLVDEFSYIYSDVIFWNTLAVTCMSIEVIKCVTSVMALNHRDMFVINWDNRIMGEQVMQKCDTCSRYAEQTISPKSYNKKYIWNIKWKIDTNYVWGRCFIDCNHLWICFIVDHITKLTFNQAMQMQSSLRVNGMAH